MPPRKHTGALSQDITKNRGTCSVCLDVFQLHNKDGTVHQHGPRSNRCPGSHKPPISAPAVSPSQPSTDNVYPDIPTPTTSTSTEPDISLSASPTVAHPNLITGTVKHIPKSARAACAVYLMGVLGKIKSNCDDLAAWSSLLTMGEDILLAPKRTGKKHNLASIIRKRAEGGLTGATGARGEGQNKQTSFKSRSPEDALASLVSSKIEDGNLRAAVRLLCSEESMAPNNQTTYEELCLKHPTRYTTIPQPINPNSPQVSILEVTEAEVLKAVKSFPAGSAGGPDGVRPQHVLQMVSCPVQGSFLLTALTGFVNLLLQGKCHPAVRPVLFGANLLALQKKSGGVRPIAVGYAWRRIAAKCANNFALSRLAGHLQPLQLGVGVKGGCEAAVHATRRFIENMPEDWVVAKLDFSNAFNSIHRDAMLEAIHSFVPELDYFCRLAYEEPTILRYGDRQILSCEGVQQGDPLGPLLFSLTLHPLLSSLNSDLKFSFLDDVTVGGGRASAEEDVRRLIEESRNIGLCINISKCEVIHTGSDISSDFPILSTFKHLLPDEANLLGAPLLLGSHMDATLSTQCANLERAVNRLKLLSAHDSLIILRHSLSAPKLNYILRAAPCAGHSSLLTFDKILRSAICSIVNVLLSDDQWLQASLPVSFGGLGIRSVSSLAPSAFLASAAGTSDLQNHILPSYCNDADTNVHRIEEIWSILSKSAGPSDIGSHSQKCWDERVSQVVYSDLLERVSDSQDKARLLAVSAPHSGDWLNAIPISSCGLRLDDEAVRVAIGLRLGTSLCEPHICICGTAVNVLGTHGLACRRSAGRIGRHQYINDIIWRALNRVNVPAVKEPLGMIRSDGKRPDGVTQIPWSEGKCVTWDVTVTDTFAASNIKFSSVTAGSAAEAAAAKKMLKYNDLIARYSFVPLAFESMGSCNATGSDFIDEIGKRSRALSGDIREKAFLWQRLSMALQRYNAICFRGTFGDISLRTDCDSYNHSTPSSLQQLCSMPQKQLAAIADGPVVSLGTAAVADSSRMSLSSGTLHVTSSVIGSASGRSSICQSPVESTSSVRQTPSCFSDSIQLNNMFATESEGVSMRVDGEGSAQDNKTAKQIVDRLTVALIETQNESGISNPAFDNGSVDVFSDAVDVDDENEIDQGLTEQRGLRQRGVTGGVAEDGAGSRGYTITATGDVLVRPRPSVSIVPHHLGSGPQIPARQGLDVSARVPAIVLVSYEMGRSVPMVTGSASGSPGSALGFPTGVTHQHPVESGAAVNQTEAELERMARD